MPILAPDSVKPGEGFKETTAEYRKTGPVKKYEPMSSPVKKLIVDAVGPVAPRVEELKQEGKEMSITTIRAAEAVATLYNKGGELGNLTPQEIAQVLISVKEAREIGLDDPNSPYYQADAALRAQRATELSALEGELDFYLTGGDRQLEDYNVDTRNNRWTWRGRSWRGSDFWVLPGRLTTVTTEVRQRARTGGLTTTEIDAAEKQSRVTEAWEDSKRRIAAEKFGKPYASLTPTERRLAAYSTSEEVAIKFADGKVKELIEQAKKGTSTDIIEDARANGSSAEKILARKIQNIEAEQEAFLRKSQELYKIKGMEGFQRFLGVGESVLSKKEITEAIIKHFGITNERQIADLTAHPDKAYKLLFSREMRLGTVVFTAELFGSKLQTAYEKRLEREEGTPAPTREGGEPPEALSKDALVGLRGEGTALLLISGELGKDPVAKFKELGIDEATAKAMLAEGEKYVNKRADGVYFINEKAIGSWDNEALSILVNARKINLKDATTKDAFKKQLLESYKALKMKKPAEWDKMAEDKINEIIALNEIHNTRLAEDKQKEIVKKWDKRNLALLAVILGPAFFARMMGLMDSSSDQRAFQNMFA